jgi:tRNA threonylcarbamoyladenosine biosynthesis protein TsaE
MEWTYALGEIDLAAARLWEHLGGRSVIAFQGDLGAGKTTLIRALCKQKGVADEVSSPTFSLINEYVFTDPEGKTDRIFHLDLYRIRDEEEALQAGLGDVLFSGSLCLVEWPEKIPGLLPEDTLAVTLSGAGDVRRLAVTPGTVGS